MAMESEGSYTYDAWARLKTAQTTGSAGYPAWGLSWDYDRYGNRKAQNVTAGSGPSNQVTPNPSTNRLTDTGYTYDLAGNMAADGVNALTYDGENRVLTSASAGVTTTYDGNSLRVQKQVGSGTPTIYLFSGTKVIAEYAAGAAVGSPTREYLYSGSQLLAKTEGGATQYHHADHFSARLTTDSTGNVVSTSGHFPYGESWYGTAPAGKWKFTSYERDAESGNDYAMFRYHVNRLARFSSPDPLAGSLFNPQSLNRYAYVRNDPANLVDPFGLDTCQAIWTDRGVEVICPGPGEGAGGGGGGGGGGRIYAPLLDGTENERGGDPGGDKKKRDLINAALKQKNLAKCLNKFFGPGTILTNNNLPQIDASKDLPGGAVGQTDANRVPETGRGTVEIDRGLFNGLPANDPFLVGTYLHETANVLAIQRFTSIQPRGARAFRGPSGGPPTEAQRNDRVDQDIGQQFEKCIFGKE